MNALNSGGFFSNIPPVTRHLIIINLIIWLAETLSGSFGNTLISLLGLHYWGSEDFFPFQLFTYMFLHDSRSFVHIFFNMFTLWMFGRSLEYIWGAKRYLFYYLLCGVGAAVVQELVWQFTWMDSYVAGVAKLNHVTIETMTQAIATNPEHFAPGIAAFKDMMLVVGASGAVFGLLLGFAFVLPNVPMYLFFIPVPIKAKYMVAGYAVLELFLGVAGADSLVAHFAHLGGMLFGIVVLLIWKKQGKLGGGFYY